MDLVSLLEECVKMIKFALYCNSYGEAVAFILVPREDIGVYLSI